MKIYVDELPKSCDKCKLGWLYDCQYCILRPDLMKQDKWCEKEKHCPLQSLADHDKQVRKEMCGRIQDIIDDSVLYTELTCSQYVALKEILDHVQGETK